MRAAAEGITPGTFTRPAPLFTAPVAPAVRAASADPSMAIVTPATQDAKAAPRSVAERPLEPPASAPASPAVVRPSTGAVEHSAFPTLAASGASLPSSTQSVQSTASAPGLDLAFAQQANAAGAGPLLELAAHDPTLHASALGKNAHLRIETEKDGDLSLHLQMHDGVVDLRIDGTASRTLDIRPNEIRAALASEGMALGTFESASPAHQPAPALHQQAASGTEGAIVPGGGSAGQPGTQTSSHSGSNSGGGARHSGPQDRWPDRAPAPVSGQAPRATSPSEPRRRRGFHVTA
jgi:hypothetical protein